MADKDVTIRKRQQIDSSKKTMFIFVAGAAFIAGVAAVVGVFLVKQILFHASVISVKQGTIATLEKNQDRVAELKDNIRLLETNSRLNGLKLKDGSSALQVVLDALPTEANADALGASLQNSFVGAVDGLRLETMTVTPVNSEEVLADEAEVMGNSLVFRMSVTGQPAQLKQLLSRFEKSIRPIRLTMIEMQASDGGRLTMAIQGQAQYEPAQKLEVGTKVVKP